MKSVKYLENILKHLEPMKIKDRVQFIRDELGQLSTEVAEVKGEVDPFNYNFYQNIKVVFDHSVGYKVDPYSLLKVILFTYRNTVYRT